MARRRAGSRGKNDRPGQDQDPAYPGPSWPEPGPATGGHPGLGPYAEGPASGAHPATPGYGPPAGGYGGPPASAAYDDGRREDPGGRSGRSRHGRPSDGRRAADAPPHPSAGGTSGTDNWPASPAGENAWTSTSPENRSVWTPASTDGGSAWTSAPGPGAGSRAAAPTDGGSPWASTSAEGVSNWTPNPANGGGRRAASGGGHRALAGASDGGWAVVQGPGAADADAPGAARGGHAAGGRGADPGADAGRGRRRKGLFGKDKPEEDAFGGGDDRDGRDFFAKDRVVSEGYSSDVMAAEGFDLDDGLPRGSGPAPGPSRRSRRAQGQARDTDAGQGPARGSDAEQGPVHGRGAGQSVVRGSDAGQGAARGFDTGQGPAGGFDAGQDRDAAAGGFAQGAGGGGFAQGAGGGGFAQGAGGGGFPADAGAEGRGSFAAGAGADGRGGFAADAETGGRGADTTAGQDDEYRETAGGGSRKRRRTPPSDWQFPVLTAMGLRPGQQKTIVIVASVIGAVAALAGVAIFATSLGRYTSDREPSAALLGPDTTLPQVFRGWKSPKLFDPLTDRAKDAKALTEKEVFGQSELSVDKKLRLKLVAKRLDSDCSAAVWGEGLTERVSDAGCTQAARGLYVSSDGRYVGQYTLLNLKDGQAATELVDALQTLYRGGWARPLPSSKGSFPAGGYSEAGGYALGHYVGLVWLGRVDGAEPGVKDDYVSLTLGLRGAEKAVYRRVVAITGPKS
ncbi:hypothetical protein ABZ917_11010 [Nonomuraea wenchangensis]